MCLKPEPLAAVPEETARVAKAAFPAGNLCLTLRDQIGTLFSDEQFLDLFPTRGQPAQAPWRLMLVTILQFAESLSDRQAAEAVRSRIDWKYLLGLELTDAGFDASVLCEFRTRLVQAGAEARAFETLLRLCKERGWVKAGGRQRTDSSHVLAAIHALVRLENVGETLRHALNVLAVAAPDWLKQHAQPQWFERYARRFEDARLPSKREERRQFALVIADDGFTLMQALWSEQAPDWLRHLPAVEVLRRVWVQQFYREGELIRWRELQEMPSAAEMIHSPYDTEARYSIKGDITWTGYKVALTETCDPKSPHLITQVTTAPATDQDLDLTAPIQEDLKSNELLPSEHLVDARFLDANLLVSSHEQGIDLIGPPARDGSWQAQAGQGFDVSQFRVDWEAKRATCPQGKQSRYWQPQQDQWGNAYIQIGFARADCAACASRALCTKSESAGRRSISVRPQAQYEALQRARERQKSEEFRSKYAARAGIEGTLSQGVRASGLRRSRYIGLAKTHLQNLMIATALNLTRLVGWLGDVPLAQTRRSALARLANVSACDPGMAAA